MAIKINHKGLTFKLWKYFIVFAATIIALLWLLQIVFLKTYYQGMKTSEIMRIGDLIIDEYGKSDFEDTIYKLSYKNGIVVRVFDGKGQSLLSTNMLGDVHPSKVDSDTISTFIQKLVNSNSNKIWYKIKDDRLNGETLVYGAVLSNSTGINAYVYINSPIEPVDATTSVLKNQLIIVTIISLLLALWLSFFFAARLALPITKLTRRAEELATGNYDITFEGSNYTEINQLASTLNYATSELAKTDELQKDLIANISHDLRTPLTLIKMYAEMIRDISGNNPEKRTIHTKIIIDETNRLSGLVNDILDLSKIQSGTSTINCTNFNLSQIVKIILTRFDILTDHDGYSFDLKCDDTTDVYADEKKIQQVIYNLISNAVNYTGDDKKVIIWVKSIKDKIRFEVVDSGKGIPKDKLQSIWDRYYKINETHKRAVVGTGLGLSIVKNILNAHNAEFGVESTLGKGSTFWFELKNVTT